MSGSPHAFRAVFTLLLLGLLGTGMAMAGAEGLAFGLFAFLTIGGGLLCVWERSVVRSAFALMGTFLGAAGFFVLLAADFLAMAQVLIYVGGILALILFGVMLTPPDPGERVLARVVGGLCACGAAVFWIASRVARDVSWAVAPELPEPVTRTREIGVAFLAPNGYVVAFELAAVLLTVALVAAVYIARRRATDAPEMLGNRGS
jgi:NADH-quinone oxidoreductase subunit J